MRKIWSILTLALVAGGLQAALAVPASADTRAGVTGGNLIVSASANANVITLNSNANGDIILKDTGDVVAATRGCLKVGEKKNEVICSGVTTVQINLGGGDDKFTNHIALKAVNTIVRGGTGSDTLIGGTASDTLIGQQGSDVLNGNGGIDTCVGDAADTKVSCER
ncbi:hypothetical protein [Streptosporangium sp. OZ121]|uniref:hypothetical protein n=1 Tax=Streptosporangium sp. OZ121 TaxID=3444183 RepID=UPI003F79EE82